MSNAIRVVFDCNVLLQGLASPGGPAGQCVQLALDGRVLLFISAGLITEFRDVTSRPKVVAKLRLVEARVEKFIESVAAAATLLADFVEPFRYERDPDDSLYVNLAVAADARCIVSRDSDLLDLMTATNAEAVDFRARFPGLRVVDPVTFLHDFGSRSIAGQGL